MEGRRQYENSLVSYRFRYLDGYFVVFCACLHHCDAAPAATCVDTAWNRLVDASSNPDG